jgi:hypothetical protein
LIPIIQQSFFADSSIRELYSGFNSQTHGRRTRGWGINDKSSGQREKKSKNFPHTLKSVAPLLRKPRQIERRPAVNVILAAGQVAIV